MAVMTREEVHEFIGIVEEIGKTDGALSKYFPREIADAIQTLINRAVAREQDNCAIVAESAAEPAGTLARGEMIAADAEKRKICLEIAQNIRNR